MGLFKKDRYQIEANEGKEREREYYMHANTTALSLEFCWGFFVSFLASDQRP